MARDVRGTGARIEAGNEERKAAWDGFTVPTKYWHFVDDGRIQCDMCPEDVPSSVELRWRPGDVQAASSLL
jgi:hypothetical protein